MLSEPVSSKSTALLHQFVIASHTLTNRISALSPDTLRHSGDNDRLSQNVVDILNEAESLARKEQVESEIKNVPVSSFNALSLIYSVAAEVRNITGRINKDEVSTL
jgi:hypothetical protein